jgi:hypothetical protein
MKRAILYISGFDPRGERFYKRTFRNELKKFSKIIKLNCQSDSKEEGKFSLKTKNVETDLFFLSWQKIIDSIYHSSKIKAWLATFIGSIIFFANFKSVKNTNKVKIFFSSIVLLDFLMLFLGLISCLIMCFYLKLVALIVMTIFILFLMTCYFFFMKRVINNRIRSWVQGFVALTCFYAKSKNKDFIKQAKIHSDHIQNIIKSSYYDEIILYGHSAGVIPLTFLLNELDKESLKKIKIITSGQCLSSYINVPHFLKLKKRIVYLMKNNSLNWMDLYSPVDGVSSRLDNDAELKSIGLSSHNAQFYKMYSKEEYSKIKLNHLRHHFHYIICGDKPINILNFYYLLTHNKPIDSYERYNEKN